jgi:hypothetical protein
MTQATNLTPDCIHGFPSDQCADCRSCRHGLITSRCGTCRLEGGRQLRRGSHLDSHLPETYQGFQIYFVPTQNSWYYRAEESTPSLDSYGSAFQARRAIDSALQAPPPKPKPTSRKKRR